MLKETEHSEFHHHEEKFAKHVSLFIKAFNHLGNPFEPDESNELIQLGTNDLIGDNVVSTVRQIEQIGKKQHNKFHEIIVFNKVVLFDDPTKKNKHLRRQSPRINQLSLNQRISKFTFNYFLRCIYLHRFVGEIC